MYSDITHALSSAGHQFVSRGNKHPDQKMGWNEYCKAAHEQAREGYLIWRENGKPRFGTLFDNMRKSRAYFKCMFRKCKHSDNVQSSDLLATKLLAKSDKDFWKEIRKINNNKICAAEV